MAPFVLFWFFGRKWNFSAGVCNTLFSQDESTDAQGASDNTTPSRKGDRMSGNLSRRGFLTGAAATSALAAIGAMTACSPSASEGQSTASSASTSDNLATTGTSNTQWSWDTPPEPVADDQIVETVESDIVVIGAGLSGVSAACRATELGASVTVLEKMNIPSSRGGHFAAYMTKAMEDMGIEQDPKSAIAADWQSLCGNRINHDLVRLFLERSGEVLDWMVEQSDGECTLLPMGARYLGNPYEHLGTHLAVGEWEDNTDNQTAPMYVLYHKSVENGADYRFECPAEQLVKEGDRVTAVIAKDADGYKKFVGTKGIILATGDISGDEEMLRAYGDELALKPRTNMYTPAGANTGDGQKMGMWVGGRMQEGAAPTMIHLIAYTQFAGPFLHVNSQGKRFMNEDSWIQAKSIDILNQPGDDQFAWSIFDANWKRDIKDSYQYGGGQFWDTLARVYGEESDPDTCIIPAVSVSSVVQTAVEGGKDAFECDTIEELAKAMGVDADVLQAEIDEYNQACESGEDTKFYKRAELLYPIKEGPFTAVRFGPATLAVVSGLVVNGNLQVLDENDEPIEGLWAVGNASGGRYAVDYPVFINGNSHGSALTWGYVAAENIVNA